MNKDKISMNLKSKSPIIKIHLSKSRSPKLKEIDFSNEALKPKLLEFTKFGLFEQEKNQGKRVKLSKPSKLVI
jgi:hypothetical protein